MQLPKPGETVFSVEGELDVEACLRGTGLEVCSEPAAGFKLACLDTWDGRLWRAGWRLAFASDGPRSMLHWHHPSSGVSGEVMARKRPSWREDLPAQAEAGFGARMHMRVLRDVLCWQGSVATCVVRDTLEKTVVRLHVYRSSVRAAGQPVSLATLVWIAPLKGYEAVARSLEAKLVERHEARAVTDLFACLFEAADVSASAYDSRLDFKLDPHMSTGDALKVLLGNTLGTVEHTLAGTKADLDSEFLHDFRVAVRRSRAWLVRLKHWLEPQIFEQLKAELGWLGSMTGQTRDLDVYLLTLPEYRAWLPPDDAQALEPLHGLLRRAQRREQRKLRRVLESERFEQLLQSWRAFLGTDAPQVADEAVIHVAGAVLARQWRRVRKAGRAIHITTPAEALHDLRIECKKLRYLLEAFSSLYDLRRMSELVRRLKQLQDVLGDFHDLEVQQDSLRAFATDLARRETPVDTFIAMGRLVEHLDHRQHAERRRFGKRWSRFDSRANNAFAKAAFVAAACAPASAGRDT